MLVVGEKNPMTTCQVMASAPMMNTTSPKVRTQRRVSSRSCCMKASLRAYHMPWLTLAWNCRMPIGNRLVAIISTRPAFRPQKPMRISRSLKAASGRT
ncbi:hypothetical protein D3C80_1823140 [compost metagenome]